MKVARDQETSPQVELGRRVERIEREASLRAAEKLYQLFIYFF